MARNDNRRRLIAAAVVAVTAVCYTVWKANPLARLPDRETGIPVGARFVREDGHAPHAHDPMSEAQPVAPNSGDKSAGVNRTGAHNTSPRANGLEIAHPVDATAIPEVSANHPFQSKVHRYTPDEIMVYYLDVWGNDDGSVTLAFYCLLDLIPNDTDRVTFVARWLAVARNDEEVEKIAKLRERLAPKVDRSGDPK